MITVTCIVVRERKRKDKKELCGQEKKGKKGDYGTVTVCFLRDNL